MVRNTISNWISNSVHVKKNTRFTFEGRMWMPALFDTRNRKRVWKTSRQVGKTTSGAAEGSCRMCLQDGFLLLYVAPEQDQARKYSHDKLDPIIQESPVIKAQQGFPKNVFEKGFARGGKIYLKYAKHNPDSCRGITADMVHYDEIQDMDLGNTEPVIRETMFTSKHKITLYSGTPKSMVNPVEKKWQQSDQREWLIRCHHHSPVKYIRLGIRNIGKSGPVCHHCDHLLDVDDGVWVKGNPSSKMAGFHVNQLHCKISHEKQSDWDEILDKYENTELALFLNEVMGESSDSAEVPISESMLISAAEHGWANNDDPETKVLGSYNFAGIDWSAGAGATTALSIGQFDQRRGAFRYVYMKTYEGNQCAPSFIIPDLMRVLTRFHVIRVHCDHGYGFGMNDRLQENFDSLGKSGIVTSNYWSNSATTKDASWNMQSAIPRLTLNKSGSLASYISRLSRNKIILPAWHDFEKFAKHFTNVRRENNDKAGTFRYDKAGQDDMFHASIYAEIIARAYFANGLQ